MPLAAMRIVISATSRLFSGSHSTIRTYPTMKQARTLLCLLVAYPAFLAHRISSVCSCIAFRLLILAQHLHHLFLASRPQMLTTYNRAKVKWIESCCIDYQLVGGCVSPTLSLPSLIIKESEIALRYDSFYIFTLSPRKTNTIKKEK